MATTIDTIVISQSAEAIDSLNKKLAETLGKSMQTVGSLTSTGSWTGEAATATVDAVTSFATKYQQEYQEKLDAYVRFLRQEAAGGYEETERANVRKADSI